MGSSPTSATSRLLFVGFIRPGGQAAKTPPFHGGNTSSILVRVTKRNKSELFRKSKSVRICFFLLWILDYKEERGHATSLFSAICTCFLRVVLRFLRLKYTIIYAIINKIMILLCPVLYYMHAAAGSVLIPTISRRQILTGCRKFWMMKTNKNKKAWTEKDKL